MNRRRRPPPPHAKNTVARESLNPTTNDEECRSLLVSINFTLGGSICTIIDLKGHESSNIPEGRDFPKTRKRAHSERVDVTIFFTISHAQLKDTAPPPSSPCASGDSRGRRRLFRCRCRRMRVFGGRTPVCGRTTLYVTDDPIQFFKKQERSKK